MKTHVNAGSMRGRTLFFFKAEGGIRDKATWLEFRRVLFRSGKESPERLPLRAFRLSGRRGLSHEPFMLKHLLALLLLLVGSAAHAETLIVHAGRLIADASRPAQGPSTITIVDGRITAVTPGLTPAPQGARLIHLSSRTVLPGLIDAHVHLMSVPGNPFWQEAVQTDDYLALVGAHNALTTVRAEIGRAHV